MVMNPEVAVVFDAFGTLLQIQGGSHPYRQLLNLARRTGRKAEPGDGRFLMTRAIDFIEIPGAMGFDVEKNELERLSYLLREELQGIQPYEDGIRAVQLLQEAGITVAVCSNLAKPYGDALLRLYPTLNKKILSFEVGAVKPEAEIYNRVCQILDVKSSSIRFIGDSESCDKQGPENYGMCGFYLSRKPDFPGDFDNLIDFAYSVLEDAE